LIYEISFIDFTWPLFIIPLIFLVFINKYIYKNDLVSNDFKYKAMAVTALIIGFGPFWSFSSHVYSNIQYLNGNFKVLEGKLLDWSDDSRYLTLHIKGQGRIRYAMYGTSCLSYRPNVENGTKVKLNYIGEKQNACIVSIQALD